MIIGVTGKSGSGKSTYTRKYAAATGYAIIDVDKVAHEVLELDYIKDKLIEIFGPDIVHDGKINRKQVGDLIFANRHLYKEYSDIVYSEIVSRINFLLYSNENVVMDWILLPHTHYWELCDKKILVTADDNVRKERVLKRDNISEKYFQKREAASISYDEYEFDVIIDTTNSREDI